MDLTKLRHIVEIHRPLSIFSSLPFAIEQDGELRVRWFVYDLTQYSSMSELVVKRIMTLDRKGRVKIELVQGMAFNIEDIESDDINFDEDEYYSEFMKLFNMHDIERINKLLQKAEGSESIKIYEAVAQYIEPVMCA